MQVQEAKHRLEQTIEAHRNCGATIAHLTGRAAALTAMPLALFLAVAFVYLPYQPLLFKRRERAGAEGIPPVLQDGHKNPGEQGHTGVSR